MTQSVDPGEAYGRLVTAHASEGDKRELGSVFDVDMRVAPYQATADSRPVLLYTGAYELSEAERAEIATGARILLHFTGGVPIHAITIEGAPDGKG